MPSNKSLTPDAPTNSARLASAPAAQVLGLTELAHTSPSSGEPLFDRAGAVRSQAAGGAPNPLHQVKAKVTVCVGGAELTIGELLEAHENQVLRLDRAIDAPVDIYLEGQVVARGTLVAVDEYFGVRITELPRPLNG